MTNRSRWSRRQAAAGVTEATRALARLTAGARGRAVVRLTAGMVAGALLASGGMVAVHAATTRAASEKASAKASSTRRVHPRPRPRFDPSRFTLHIDNAWFPLKPGIRYVYRGTEEGKHSRDLVTVTHGTKVIDGITTRVVNDRLFLDGLLRERTSDYYVEDEDGNVWYFGEDTAELDRNGNVTSREGTWHAGIKGAEPGIIMQANPQVGDTFQQEFWRGHAEDHYSVRSLTQPVKVPYGSFGGNKLRRRVELTKEWSPLEPEVRDHKYYVRGIGFVKEETVRGPLERGVLVKIVRI